MTKTGKDRFEAKFGTAYEDLSADINVLFNRKKREFYEYYALNVGVMDRIRQAFHNLLSLITSEIQNGSPKVLSRVKDRNECIRKFETKYRTVAEKENREGYKIESYMTDMIGVRVICLYEDDVPVVHKLIGDNFQVLEITDKTQLLAAEHDKFGYKGLHINIKLGNKRSKLPEYKGFDGFQVEVQIRSIVQDAWSEIDHRLKYKKSIPAELKRRIIRIAALFELADQEFTQIRKNTEVLETLLDASEELHAERVIDSFSFISVMKRHFSNYNFDNEPESESARKIDGFVQEVVSMNPHLTDDEFKAVMEEYLPKMTPFLERKLKHGLRLNPFTITRHILYWSNPSFYADALFEAQRVAFDKWIEDHGKGTATKGAD